MMPCKNGECCYQLEAEAIDSNSKLLKFDVKSKDIEWRTFIVPLSQRGCPVYLHHDFSYMSNYRETVGEENRRKVLVCHDMMGNYLEDRFFHSSKKFDEYRFFHWSAIDYFCYFSHKYITIPPCVWINAGHKHGVRVLGTFITEGYKGTKLLEEVLHSKEMVDSVVDAMVRLCKHYCFEGWLVNIECKVKNVFVDNLFYFLQKLRTETEATVKNGVIFWYDSVIDSGELLWQNEINSKNVRFFKASDAMLINYGWNDKSLENTMAICNVEGESRTKSFFGIDVFGREQLAKFQSKKTLARIAQRGFSVGIFAPGWTFETLQQFNYNIRQPGGSDEVNNAFLERNDKFWWSLWEHLPTHPYAQLPFYTDFCVGSGKFTFTNGSPEGGDDRGRFFNLSRQSIQPSVPLHRRAERFYNDAFNGGSCLKIIEFDSSFRLFATDFKLAQGGLIFAYAFKLDPRYGEFDCVLRFSLDDNTKDCYLFLGDYLDSCNFQKGRCYVSPIKKEYNNSLLSIMDETRKLSPELNGSSVEGWKVRFYVVTFDLLLPVQVRDIGVMCRKSESSHDAAAYLGAIFMSEIDRNAVQLLPTESNRAVVPIRGGDLLN